MIAHLPVHTTEEEAVADPEQWHSSDEKAEWLVERLMLENLIAYANNIRARSIPLFILDPMLGVRPPTQRDGGSEDITDL